MLIRSYMMGRYNYLYKCVDITFRLRDHKFRYLQGLSRWNKYLKFMGISET